MRKQLTRTKKLLTGLLAKGERKCQALPVEGADHAMELHHQVDVGVRHSLSLH